MIIIGDTLKYRLEQAFIAAAVEVNKELNKKPWTSFARLRRGVLRGNFQVSGNGFSFVELTLNSSAVFEIDEN